MSRKRTTAESNNDEQTNENSDPVGLPQNGNDAKRAKLTLSSDTKLQDLPIEMLERILVQVVVTEVKDMKVAKSVWKNKAGLVINRLTIVCSHWSSILTTDDFRNEVNRVLDGTAQEPCRLEILHQYPLPCKVSKMTTNKEEIFLLCTHAQGDLDRVIHVYDRNNMAEVKDVIVLPRRNAKAIEGCMVSNCLYVLYMDFPGISMLRITRDEQHHQFNISPWISDYKLSYANMSVSANGNVVIASNLQRSSEVLVSVYDANGLFQHKLKLLPNVHRFRIVKGVMQKSDGNFVVVYNDDRHQRILTEIDSSGRILRQYQSSLGGFSVVKLADISGRIFMAASPTRIEVLDSELNLLDFDGSMLDKILSVMNERLHCDIARNEVIDIVDVYDDKFKNCVLTIFRLT